MFTPPCAAHCSGVRSSHSVPESSGRQHWMSACAPSSGMQQTTSTGAGDVPAHGFGRQDVFAMKVPPRRRTPHQTPTPASPGPFWGGCGAALTEGGAGPPRGRRYDVRAVRGHRNDPRRPGLPIELAVRLRHWQPPVGTLPVANELPCQQFPVPSSWTSVTLPRTGQSRKTYSCAQQVAIRWSSARTSRGFST